MTAIHYMGIGHESDADLAAALALAERCCRLAGVAPADIALIASLDVKAEAGLVAAIAQAFGCRLSYFTAAILEAETPRLLNPSEAVFRAVGCHGVAEAAALAAAGLVASLIVPKTSADGITCAIARRGVSGR